MVLGVATAALVSGGLLFATVTDCDALLVVTGFEMLVALTESVSTEPAGVPANTLNRTFTVAELPVFRVKWEGVDVTRNPQLLPLPQLSVAPI